MCYLVRIADTLILNAGIDPFVSSEIRLSVLKEGLGIKASAYNEISKEIIQAGFLDSYEEHQRIYP